MARDWGTLGEPFPPDNAYLVHVVRTSVATLFHAFYEAGTRVSRHRHDHESVVYGVGGMCVEKTGADRIIARRLTYLPIGFEHELLYLGPTHVLSIEIDPAWKNGRLTGTWPNRAVHLPATLYNKVWRAMVLISEQASAPSIEDALAALWVDINSQLRNKPHNLLDQVVDYLHEKWRDVPSAAEIASAMDISPQYLCRIFKKRFGVTIQQYSLLLRLDYARGLLWGTEMPISQIAAETGFADQSHLTRVLAISLGKTPARLRWRAPCVAVGFDRLLDAP
jgi:AraC-like DNA-binding protein